MKRRPPGRAWSRRFLYTGLAQSVEHWSPKPGVGSSSLSTRAKKDTVMKFKLLTNIQEAYDELRYKTSWPSRKQLVKSAIIVMIASVIIALIIFIMDQIVDHLMHFIYSL